MNKPTRPLLRWHGGKWLQADGARPRTEVLWINPAAIAAIADGPLFGAVA